MRTEQLERIHNGKGFIAALDQSGGSTPKALQLYGVEPSQYSNEDEMFALIHSMRTRIITSSTFTNKRILAVILFGATMRSKIEGFNTADYLWKVKGIPSFLKVDLGLAELKNGVQLMKDIPNIQAQIAEALHHNMVGTKMRSVIHSPSIEGISNCLDQQFDFARTISAASLLPIIEPEVSIHSSLKDETEKVLLEGLISHLGTLSANEKVVLKLTLPEERNLYKELLSHPNIIRVAALSGGYSRQEANKRLSENDGLIASFSRALTEGLSISESDIDFDQTLNTSIESIYQASL